MARQFGMDFLKNDEMTQAQFIKDYLKPGLAIIGEEIGWKFTFQEVALVGGKTAIRMDVIETDAH